jgi:hypothetical protein
VEAAAKPEEPEKSRTAVPGARISPPYLFTRTRIMELTVKLEVTDFPQGFDHFVRVLSLQIASHLTVHLEPLIAALPTLPPPVLADFTEASLTTLAGQVAFRVREALASDSASRRPPTVQKG